MSALSASRAKKWSKLVLISLPIHFCIQVLAARLFPESYISFEPWPMIPWLIHLLAALISLTNVGETRTKFAGNLIVGAGGIVLLVGGLFVGPCCIVSFPFVTLEARYRKQCQNIITQMESVSPTFDIGSSKPIKPYILSRCPLSHDKHLPDLTNAHLYQYWLEDFVKQKRRLGLDENIAQLVKNVVIISEEWVKTGFVMLDRGSAPFLTHRVHLFVLDLSTGSIIWSDSIDGKGGGLSPIPEPGGGIRYVSEVRGNEVKNREIENAIERIPWEK